MNRSLTDILTSPSLDLPLIQQHELCRQQSRCYLLAPPPRPPSIPDLFLATTCRLSSTSTFINARQRTESSFSFLTIISITLGTLIALATTCLILFLLGVKFQCYHKLRHRRRTAATTNSSVNSSIRGANNSDVAFIKTTNTNGGGDVAGCASFSSVAPTSYGCLTPLTTTTTTTNHPYRSLPMMANSNLSLQMTHSQQNLDSDENSPCHHHSSNIYEEIRPTYNRHPCCCCCSCTLAHYHQQQRQLTPHYYTCEPSTGPSSVVCQSCLLETLHRKPQHSMSSTNCACHNFFVPIK